MSAQGFFGNLLYTLIDCQEQVVARDGFLANQVDGRATDRYGRQLRVVTRGGRSLGDVLVAEGLARPWEGSRRPWCG